MKNVINTLKPKVIRKLKKYLLKIPILIESIFDKSYLHPDVPMSSMVSHENWEEYLYQIGNNPGFRILGV